MEKFAVGNDKILITVDIDEVKTLVPHEKFSYFVSDEHYKYVCDMAALICILEGGDFDEQLSRFLFSSIPPYERVDVSLIPDGKKHELYENDQYYHYKILAKLEARRLSNIIPMNLYDEGIAISFEHIEGSEYRQMVVAHLNYYPGKPIYIGHPISPNYENVFTKYFAKYVRKLGVHLLSDIDEDGNICLD